MRARGLASNSALALAGDLASKAGMMAVMMLAARGLGTGQFALLGTAIAAATVLTAGFDLGSQTLLTRDGVGGPGSRGSLLRALALARAPLLAAAAALAIAAGLAAGAVGLALATVATAAVGAAQLSLTGALRSASDLGPEAIAKLAAGILSLAAAGGCLLLAPSAAAVMTALALAGAVALIPLLPALRTAVAGGPPVAARSALWRAAPLGAMALATLAYYRSGTIAVALFSTPTQTARFTAVSTIGFGLLALANAVTTGLLPRLAASGTDRGRVAVTRSALRFTAATSLLLGGLVAVTAGPLLQVVFGARFAPAAGPLAILALATVVIGPAGVFGTALIAAGRVRPVAVQVGCSLVVNLLLLVVLVPATGATGAALATLGCELVAAALLGRAAHEAMPGLLARRPRRAPVLPVTTGSAR